MLQRRRSQRFGVAAVELAVLMPFLVALLIGLWELGRYLMVMNVLENAAREGARLSSTGSFFSSNNYNDTVTGQQMTLIYSEDSSGNPIPFDVQKRVQVYLQAAGLSTTGATIKVENLNQNWSGTYPGSTSTGSYDPAAAASQLDHLRVTVNMPYSTVQWSAIGMFVSNSATLIATADFYSMRNVPFTVSTTIPQKP
jgi:Flp pilus assembly protein TadG